MPSAYSPPSETVDADTRFCFDVDLDIFKHLTYLLPRSSVCGGGCSMHIIQSFRHFLPIYLIASASLSPDHELALTPVHLRSFRSSLLLCLLPSPPKYPVKQITVQFFDLSLKTWRLARHLRRTVPFESAVPFSFLLLLDLLLHPLFRKNPRLLVHH